MNPRKRCAKCGVSKRLTAFRLRRDFPGRRRLECLACEGIARRSLFRKRTKRQLLAEYEADRQMFLGLLEDGAALFRDALRRIAQLEGRES